MLDLGKLKGNPPNFVIITGLSGSGMSTAMNAFEDIGYFCVDNLPATMLEGFAHLLLPSEAAKAKIKKAALVLDIREGDFLPEFTNEITKLKQTGDPFIIFFEAKDEVISRRFSETRRPHPADDGEGLLAAISVERRMFAGIRTIADLIVDTSEQTVHDLRRLILKSFEDTNLRGAMTVEFTSFGHKFGAPSQLDLMFDVRHLPNPYFEPTLRAKTGRDVEVVDFLEGMDEVGETLKRFTELLEYLLPKYAAEGKSYLTIGIGCTGGKHRSVMIADRLSTHFSKTMESVSVTHRDIGK
jgi:UPF0042 nucleotide-binding protein